VEKVTCSGIDAKRERKKIREGINLEAGNGHSFVVRRHNCEAVTVPRG